MGNTFYFDWEPALIEWLQANIGAVGAKIASVITMLGGESMMIVVLSFLYFWMDKEKGRYVGRRCLPFVSVNAMIKNVFCRLRPYFVHEGVKILVPVEPKADLFDVAAQGYSFPSGHSYNAAATFGSVAGAYRKKSVTVPMIVLIFLVGVSRFFVGAHYPTDVICGWVLGILSIGLYSFLEKKIKDRRVIYLIMALIALPGMFWSTTNDYYTGYGIMLGFFLGDLFEDRYVHFENTKNVLRGILRIVGVFGLYFGLNAVLKMPFSKEFLESGKTAALLVRTARYTVTIFILIGIYPMLFKFTDRFWKKKEQ